MKEVIVLDIEVGPNYFLIGFKKLTGEVKQFELKGQYSAFTHTDIKSITTILRKYRTVGFNSIKYDIPMITASLLYGKNVASLFKMSAHIIKEGLQNWQTYREYDLTEMDIDHVDISEPAPGVMVSLKGYGARLHSQKIQDLPYPYDKVLTADEQEVVAKYNINDLDTTIDLYLAIKDRLDLRDNLSKRYGINLTSKSDAQIAEAVLVSELTKIGVTVSRDTIPSSVTYVAPKCVQFRTPILNQLKTRIQTAFSVNPKNGSPVLPDWLKKFRPEINGKIYQIGIGGLHSKEKKLVVIPTADEILGNIDVASYYPSMIIEFGFYPKRLTKHFLTVYKAIYAERMDAKLKKITAINEGFKIVLNGTFGKLGSKYSKIYAPLLMLQVTITGQLLLLMLIEKLESAGITIQSANTDGIEYLCPKDKQDLLKAIVFDWELNTGMVMEFGEYNALYARDVNNYVAVYDDHCKAIGVYASPIDPKNFLKKNSEYPIVFTAIRQYLFDGTPLEKTIRECKNISQFLTSRAVKGGGEFRGKFLGKTVRWYYATDGDAITYASNGNKVATSDGAYPMMELTKDIPSNLSYDKYFELAVGHLNDLGVKYA